MNSLRHGFFSQSLLLPGEDAAELDQLKIDFIETLLPRNSVELRLVERIVAAEWRLQRMRSAEGEMGARCVQDIRDRARDTADQSRRRLVKLQDRLSTVEQVPVAGVYYYFPKKRTAMIDKLRGRIDTLQKSIAAIDSSTSPAAIAIDLLDGPRAARFIAMQKHIQQLENSIHRCHKQIRDLRAHESKCTSNSFAEDLLSALRCSAAPGVDNAPPIGSDQPSDASRLRQAAPPADPAPAKPGEPDAGGGASQNDRNEPNSKLVGGAEADFQPKSDGQRSDLRGRNAPPARRGDDFDPAGAGKTAAETRPGQNRLRG